MAHAAELKNYLSTLETTPDIICIQETFLKPGKNFNLDGYHMVRRDREGETRKGGLATFIKTGVNYKINDDEINIECILVQIRYKNTIYTIANIYNSPEIDMDIDAYRCLFQYKNCIITGDFNAHNPLWKSKSLNRRGRVIEELIEEYNFVLINTGQPTYQGIRGGMSVLDLTMVSSEIGLKCTWTVLEDAWGSDHLPTITTINEPIGSDITTPPRWLLEKADWLAYRAGCVY
jgi:exonuclease III